MNKCNKKFNFDPIAKAIKSARIEAGLSRNEFADIMHISPRYIAEIENQAKAPSLKTFYDLVTTLEIPVDAFFFPDNDCLKSETRSQLDSILNKLVDDDLKVLKAAAKAMIDNKKIV